FYLVHIHPNERTLRMGWRSNPAVLCKCGCREHRGGATESRTPSELLAKGCDLNRHGSPPAFSRCQSTGSLSRIAAFAALEMSASGHSRHSRHLGVSGSPQKRAFGQSRVYEYTACDAAENKSLESKTLRRRRVLRDIRLAT